ncbi:VOC family protein [Thalassobius sp. Cn5-15]|uniref:VOC family protein n=1 Tax=Thalassobius sp. Cn5-15 TaxID=2917763 RepID=UPI001EF161EF|nr:VOC family protein [Thalassobius sp. Cn5-15]MCG7494428.1 VOC family protein [Thalassobius sp. Cn5-15]
MEQRISLITLGCRDIAAQTAFYRAMGWWQVDTPDGVVAFDLLSQVLGLYPLAALAADIGVAEDQLLHAGPDAPGPAKYAAATLGYNAGNPAEVDQVMAAAAEAGAAVLKPAAEVFWGGYHGYFADPEGTVWEVAHNPFSPLGPNGAFCWNGFHANAT